MNVHLLLIDVQKDFCHPEGALFVAGRSGRGAVDDSRRIAEFIYKNLDALTAITTTMDTHFSHQIFFPSFWVDREGRPLASHRVITTRDVDTGEARPTIRRPPPPPRRRGAPHRPRSPPPCARRGRRA
jgi:nicotinamidase-related amidase